MGRADGAFHPARPHPVVRVLAGKKDPRLQWCANQRRLRRLAITYERRTNTFGLAQSFFNIDIGEDEARAFVALQEGFAPGTPYAGAVQNLLQRWEWLFTEKSRQLVRQKRKRHARPVLLPLSPVVVPGPLRMPAFVAATEEGVRGALRQGLSGWPVTDCRVTMTASQYCPRQSRPHQNSGVHSKLFGWSASSGSKPICEPPCSGLWNKG